MSGVVNRLRETFCNKRAIFFFRRQKGGTVFYKKENKFEGKFLMFGYVPFEVRGLQIT